MKILLIDVDLSKVLKLFKKKEPEIRHQVKNEPPKLVKQWRDYWFRDTEPADAWLID